MEVAGSGSKTRGLGIGLVTLGSGLAGFGVDPEVPEFGPEVSVRVCWLGFEDSSSRKFILGFEILPGGSLPGPVATGLVPGALVPGIPALGLVRLGHAESGVLEAGASYRACALSN